MNHAAMNHSAMNDSAVKRVLGIESGDGLPAAADQSHRDRDRGGPEAFFCGRRHWAMMLRN